MSGLIAHLLRPDALAHDEGGRTRTSSGARRGRSRSSSSSAPEGPSARREAARGGALLDRDAPVDAVLLGRIVARRPVVRAAVVPDDDVARAPPVAVLALGLDHVA